MNFSQKFVLLLLVLLRMSTIKCAEPKHKAIYTNFCTTLKEELLKIEYDLIRVEGPFPGRIIDWIKVYGYYVEKKIDNESDAKILYVQVRDRLIALINNYAPLRPYLMVYPFKYDNVSVHIMCRDRTGQTPKKPFISGITSADPGFQYCYTVKNGLEWHGVVLDDE